MADSGFSSEVKRLVDRSGGVGGAGGVMRLQYLMGAGSSLYVAAMHIHVGGLGSAATQAMARYVPQVRVTGPGTVNQPQAGIAGFLGASVGGSARSSFAEMGAAIGGRDLAAPERSGLPTARGLGRARGRTLVGGPPGEGTGGWNARLQLPETGATGGMGKESWFVKASDAAGRLLALGSAASVATGAIMGLARTASPQVAATFTGSLEMAQARLGKVFLPALDEGSRAVQRFVAGLDTAVGRFTTGALGKLGAAAVGGFMGGRGPGWTGYLAGSLPGTSNALGMAQAMGRMQLIPGSDKSLRKWLDDRLAKQEEEEKSAIGRGVIGIARSAFNWVLGGDEKAMKRSMAGLPAAQVSSAEDYYDRLQTAALNTDDIQTDILKQQLEALKEFGGLLEGIQANTSKIGGIIPAFR